MQSGTGEEFSIWAEGGRPVVYTRNQLFLGGEGGGGRGVEGPPADTECRSHAEPAKSKNIVNNITMVRRGSVGSASACWKAGPSSILGSAPQGGFSPLSTSAMRKWREASANGDG
jgi:hypothetical protein